MVPPPLLSVPPPLLSVPAPLLTPALLFVLLSVLRVSQIEAGPEEGGDLVEEGGGFAFMRMRWCQRCKG